MQIQDSRKAQMPGQIFIYILAIIIVGVIIAYGYTAIKDFSARGEQVAFISFKTDFENTVKTMVSDYGTIKRPEFSIPQKYKKVCVIDFKKGYSEGYSSDTVTCIMGDQVKFEPLVCNAWKQGASQYGSNPNSQITLSNVFLTPDGSDSFNVDKIRVASGILCAPVKNGKIKMQFKSLGDGVEISLYE
ncbi:MAG: hypothetical protein KJ574_05325 [Nanoarchaeota archaeon]|nr:hypothetical protein [Nanoarchaeota archaeon]